MASYFYDPATGKMVDRSTVSVDRGSLVNGRGVPTSRIQGQQGQDIVRFGAKEQAAYTQDQRLKGFGKDMLSSIPGFTEVKADRLTGLDQGVMDQFRNEAYRGAGTASPWLGAMQTQSDQLRGQALSGLQDTTGTQKQSAWNRMATGGARGGSAQRFGHKADLASAFGAQDIMSGARQGMQDYGVMDEQDRQAMVGGAGAFEHAAGAGARSQAQMDMDKFGSRQRFEQGTADARAEVDAAQKLASQYIDQKQLAKAKGKMR